VNTLYSELQWLPRCPEDFSARVKALAAAEGPLGREVQSLALHALDLNRLTRLAKAIDAARPQGRSLEPLVPFRLAVLSNSTIDLVVPALVASAARHGIALEVIQPSYDQVAQEALTPDTGKYPRFTRSTGRRAQFPQPADCGSQSDRRSATFPVLDSDPRRASWRRVLQCGGF